MTEEDVVPGLRVCALQFFFFFFSSRRRHTRCSRDWSSDVCSSDLVSPLRYDAVQTSRMRLEAWDTKIVADRFRGLEAQCQAPLLDEGHAADRVQIGRASCRERV